LVRRWCGACKDDGGGDSNDDEIKGKEDRAGSGGARWLGSRRGEARSGEDEVEVAAARDDSLNELDGEWLGRRWAAIDRAAGRGGSGEE
jgi:hypothetical protein